MSHCLYLVKYFRKINSSKTKQNCTFAVRISNRTLHTEWKIIKRIRGDRPQNIIQQDMG